MRDRLSAQRFVHLALAGIFAGRLGMGLTTAAAKPPEVPPIILSFHETPIFLRPHEHTVSALAFSPDGKTLATGCGDSHLRLWDCTSGRLKSIHAYDASRGIDGLAYSPDGRQLAAVGGFFGKELVVWDTTTGKVARDYEEHPRSAKATSTAGPQMFYKGKPIDFRGLSVVAFSPDGKVLVTAPDGLLFRDAQSGSLLASPKNPGKSIKSAAFSADGKFLATADEDRKVRMWSVLNGALEATLDGPTQPLSSVAISADGRRVVATSSGNRSLLSRNPDPVGNVWIWNQLSGPARKIEIGNVHVRQAAFINNSTVVVAAGNELLSLDVSQDGTPEPHKIWTHSEEVRSLAVSPDGRLLASGGLDRTVDIVDISTGTLVHRLPGLTDVYSSVVVSGDGKRFATATLDTRFCNRRPAEDESFAARMQKYFTGDANSGRLQSGAVQVWSLGDGRRQLLLPLAEGTQVTAVSFVPNQDQLILAGWLPGSGGMLSLWDLASGKRVHEFAVPKAEVLSIVVSPDGQLLASGDGDGKVELRQLPSGTVIRSHQLDHRAAAVTFSADGKLLAVGDGVREVQIIDVADGKTVKKLHTRSPMESLDFSPDGNWLAAGTRDPGLELWDLRGNSDSRTLRVEADHFAVMPGFVAISRDSRLVVCGGRGKDIAVFETATGKLVHELRGHAHAPTAADFLPDGRLVSGGEERTLRLWDVPSQKCLVTWIAMPADAQQDWHDEWIGYKPSGEFVGSDPLDRLVGWQAGGEVYLGQETAGHQRRVTNLFEGSQAAAPLNK